MDGSPVLGSRPQTTTEKPTGTLIIVHGTSIPRMHTDGAGGDEIGY